MWQAAGMGPFPGANGAAGAAAGPQDPSNVFQREVDSHTAALTSTHFDKYDGTRLGRGASHAQPHTTHAAPPSTTGTTPTPTA